MAQTPSVDDVHGLAIECLGRLWQLAAFRQGGDRFEVPLRGDEFEVPLSVREKEVHAFMEAFGYLRDAQDRGKSCYDECPEKARLDHLGIHQVFGTAGHAPYEITFKVAKNACDDVWPITASRYGRFAGADSETKAQWARDILRSFKVPFGDLEHLQYLLREPTGGGGRVNPARLFPKGVPKNIDVRDLACLLDAERAKPKGERRSDRAVALEFTSEVKWDRPKCKARSLINQIGRLKRKGEIDLADA